MKKPIIIATCAFIGTLGFGGSESIQLTGDSIFWDYNELHVDIPVGVTVTEHVYCEAWGGLYSDAWAYTDNAFTSASSSGVGSDYDEVTSVSTGGSILYVEIDGYSDWDEYHGAAHAHAYAEVSW